MSTLTDKQIRTLKPGKHSDGRGLSLVVSQTQDGTGKSWCFRFLWQGKERTLSLGRYPDVSIEEARRRLQDARTQVANGINPCDAKKASKQATRLELVGRFQAVSEGWLARFYPAQDAKRARIEAWLTTYIYPKLGQRPISTIGNADVAECLDALVVAGKLDSANRLFRVLEKIWPWAVGRGYAKRNIMEDLQGDLPPPVRNKFPGLTNPAEVGQLLRAIDAYPSRKPQVRMCMQLMPYFAQRPSELREARWEEFDLKNALWRIPAKRMKVGKKVRPPHVVPIPPQALAILQRLSVLSEHVESPADVEAQILILRAQGYGKNKIARLVGVGDGTVQSILKDAPPLPDRPRENQWTGGKATVQEEYGPQICALLAQGVSQREIARRLNISHTSVGVVAKAQGMEPVRHSGNLHPVVPLDHHNTTPVATLSRPAGYLFPSRERRSVLSPELQPFSDGTVNKALRLMGYCTRKGCECDKLHHSGHGWRTTFSTLARDALRMNFHVKEKQLSHATPGVAGDYDEATDIDARITEMQRWADYLDKLRTLPVESQRRSATQAAM